MKQTKQNKSEKQMWCYNMYWFADKITIDKINTYYNKVYERFKDKLVDYYGTITHAERIKKKDKDVNSVCDGNKDKKNCPFWSKRK